mgnify:CR=1 FL=1
MQISEGLLRIYSKSAGVRQVKPVEEAVEQAISECIQEGIMAEFLKQKQSGGENK